MWSAPNLLPWEELSGSSLRMTEFLNLENCPKGDFLLQIFTAEDHHSMTVDSFHLIYCVLSPMHTQ